MSLNLGTKVLAGAIAMAIGAAAMANTNLDGTTTGDVFLNIVDMSNSTSFLYDTGISQANFTSSTTFTPVNLASDPNYQAFIAAAGTATLDYSVTSATNNGSTKANEFTVDTTGSIVPASQDILRGNLGGAEVAVSQFLTLTNGVTSTTTNSVFLSGQGTNGEPAFWGQGLAEGEVSLNLFSQPNAPFADNAAPGTPATFYQVSVNGGVTTLGAFDLNGSVLSFSAANAGTGPSPVPLPTPLLLLLSGLGLMGVVARRGKPSADLASGAAAV